MYLCTIYCIVLWYAYYEIMIQNTIDGFIHMTSKFSALMSALYFINQRLWILFKFQYKNLARIHKSLQKSFGNFQPLTQKFRHVALLIEEVSAASIFCIFENARIPRYNSTPLLCIERLSEKNTSAFDKHIVLFFSNVMILYELIKRRRKKRREIERMK